MASIGPWLAVGRDGPVPVSRRDGGVPRDDRDRDPQRPRRRRVRPQPAAHARPFGHLGWLTLAIVATTFLAYRAADPRLAAALAICVPVYVLAFYTGNFAFRAATGGVLCSRSSCGCSSWTWRTYLAGERSLPRLGLAFALTTFTYGAIVGVLLQISFAAETTIVPGRRHRRPRRGDDLRLPRARRMSIAEWRVLGTTGMPRGGLVQLGALFIGGLDPLGRRC